MKFRVVEKLVEDAKEEIKNWNVDKYIRKHIIGLSTEEIIEKASLNVVDGALTGPSFILPNGDSVAVDNGGFGNPDGMHQDILVDICRRILYKETKLRPDINRGAIVEPLYDYLIDTLGWVKMNTGSGASDNRCYVVIPNRKVRMKNAQYSTLEDCLWIAYNKKKNQVQILEGFDIGGAIGRYSFNNYTPDQIIKEIKNFYSGGSFIYESKQLNEIYPNKGESKKDFIARFMSVTKDEYPDVKQRYAVANSYWGRRDKKRVNESHGFDINYIDYDSRGWILPSGDILSTENEPHFTTMNDEEEDSIRYNFGHERYIGLPNKAVTQEQLDTLMLLLDYYFVNKESVGVRNTPIEIDYNMNDKGDFKHVRLSPKDYISDDIIKKIKRYYSSGVLYESTPVCNESKENYITLYHNTPYKNVDSILKNGLSVSSSTSEKPSGWQMTWASTKPQMKGEYGGNVIKFRLPKDYRYEKVNDDQYIIYDDIEPELIDGVDYLISREIANMHTSQLRDYIEEYGKDRVRDALEKYHSEEIPLNKIKELTKELDW